MADGRTLSFRKYQREMLSNLTKIKRNPQTDTTLYALILKTGKQIIINLDTNLNDSNFNFSKGAC